MRVTRSRTSFRKRSLPPLHPDSADRRTTFGRQEFDELFLGETGLVERKSGAGKKPLQEAMVAFSNARGGVILIGVSDSGQLLGRKLNPAVEQEIEDAAAEARDPGPHEIYELDVEGASVVAVTVAARASGIAQTSDGRVLQRKGPRNRPLFGNELLALLQSKSQEPFESTASTLKLADADPVYLAEMQTALGWTEEDLDEGLHEQGLLRDDGQTLTVAGALFLVRAPESRFAKAVVELRRFRGQGREYELRDTFSGPPHRQVAEAHAAVMRELGREIVLAGAYRQEISRLPSDVVREAISNAVAHRRYDLTGQRTVIELRPDQVVITSPGGLVEGVRLERLRTAQAARNNAIIGMLRAFDLAEDSGRGIDLMQDEMTEAMLEQPRFLAEPDQFRVELPLQAVVTREERAWVLDLERRHLLRGVDKLVVVAAARAGSLTNSDVRDVTHLDSTLARESLKRLVEAGVLLRQGERGGATYALAPRFAQGGRQLDVARARRVLLKAAAAGPLTNDGVRRLVGVDADTARGLLRGLVADGRLEPLGRTRDRRYELVR